MDTCEMVDVSPGWDGMGHETPCTDVAVATAEDGQRVCEKHAESMAVEGFDVTRDVAK